MQPLTEYVQEKRSKGFSDSYIEQLAEGKGYTKDEVQRLFPAQKKKKSKVWILFVIIAILIIAPAIFYFTVISPAFVSKPVIEMPAATDSSEEQISYFVNELDGYKLHADPRNSEPPVIEFFVTDDELTYSVVVDDGTPVTSLGSAPDADLRISLDSDEMVELIESDDMNLELVSMVNSGEVQIEMLNDEVTLGLKGYKALYDATTEDSGSPTGNTIALFNSKLFV